MRRRRPALRPPRALVAAIVLIAAAAHATVTVVAAGMPLVEALRLLQRDGLRVVFSSALVPAGLTVASAPRARAPAAVLAEILAPHGLAAVPGPGGRWLVVPGSPAADGDATAAAAEPHLVLAERLEVRAPLHLVSDPATGARSLARDGAGDALAEVHDVGEALALLPGTAGLDVLAATHLRGARSEESQILLDGLELPLARWASLQGAVGVLDEGAIDRLDVLAGGYPAEYGGRIGGLLELRSARVERTHTEVGFGSLGARLYHARPLGADDRFSIALRGGDLEPYFAVEDGAYGRVAPRYGDLFAKWEHRLGDGGTVAGELLASRDHTRVVGEEGRRVFDATALQRHAWVRLERAWTAAVWGRTLLAASATREDGARTTSRAPRPATTPVATLETSRRRASALELRQDFTVAAGTHVLKAGLRVLRERLDDAGDRGSSHPPPTLAGLDLGGSASEVYASDRVALPRGGSLELGLRWEGQTWAGGEWSPRGNLVLPAGRGRVRAAIGRVTEAQRLDEIARVALPRRPHPAQIADQAVVGYERPLAAGLVQLELYHTEVRRAWPRAAYRFGATVEVDPAAAPERLVIEGARLQGVELLLRHRLGTRLAGSLAYTQARATDAVGRDRVARDWDQRHALDAQLVWHPAPPWRLALAGFYHSGWPTSGFEVLAAADGERLVVGERNGARGASYQRVDLTVARDLRLPRGVVTLELEITNLLDRRNTCCTAGYSAEILPAGGFATERLDRALLPRRATFGVTWTN